MMEQEIQDIINRTIIAAKKLSMTSNQFKDLIPKDNHIVPQYKIKTIDKLESVTFNGDIKGEWKKELIK